MCLLRQVEVDGLGVSGELSWGIGLGRKETRKRANGSLFGLQFVNQTLTPLPGDYCLCLDPKLEMGIGFM